MKLLKSNRLFRFFFFKINMPAALSFTFLFSVFVSSFSHIIYGFKSIWINRFYFFVRIVKLLLCVVKLLDYCGSKSVSLLCNSWINSTYLWFWSGEARSAVSQVVSVVIALSRTINISFHVSTSLLLNDCDIFNLLLKFWCKNDLMNWILVVLMFH